MIAQRYSVAYATFPLLLLTFCLTLTLYAQVSAQTPDTPVNTLSITVRVTGARNAEGKIGVALFRTAEGFPEEYSKATAGQWVQIDPHTLSAQAIFNNVPRGSYAVSVLHDENLNGKLDRSFVCLPGLCMPKEGYGASNNPPKRLGPPKFDDAKFTLDRADVDLEIKLIYWL
jgi:uncharacterized protein (DUF2141 family)